MITSYGPRHARGARREQVLPDALVINEAGPPNPTATISQLAILGHSASSTVTSPATVGALPWFPINMGTLKTPGLAWRTHLHSEIAGLGSNWASSPLLAVAVGQRVSSGRVNSALLGFTRRVGQE
jgi:hypothetical protein